MKIKKLSISMIAMLLISTFSLNIIYATDNSKKEDSIKNEFNINAKSGILLDAKSGKIIYEKNIHEKLAPASITKVMVMLLAMEDLESKKISLEDKVTVSLNASKMGGSQLFLHEGETQTIENLLKSIALRSANDSSVALSEHIGGSLDLFIERMNKRSEELGMKNTHFKNPTGLPDEGHYSTAYDISLMSKELLKYPKINEWLTMWMDEIKVGKNKDIVQSLVNTNKLIRFYEGANGIKTGYTNDAGFCLSASAKRGNLSLISVILGSETSNERFDEAKKLLNHGFLIYDSIVVNKKGDVIKNVQVSKGNIKNVDVILKEDVNILVKKGEDRKIEREVRIPNEIKAPFRKNQVLGELIIKIDGEEFAKEKLVCNKEIKKATIIDLYDKGFRSIIAN